MGRDEQLPTDPMELGRLYTSWFGSGELDRLWSRLSPELQRALGGASGLRRFREQVHGSVGTETTLLDERLIPWIGSRIYARTAGYGARAQRVLLQWVLDAQGVAIGYTVEPATEPAATRHGDYQTRTSLRLPFAGDWFVFWGGRTVVENYHAVTPDQRFAYDFVIVKENRTHTGDGSRNEQYHCFGQPILAPGAGTVIATSNVVEDNRVGVMNGTVPFGNVVVLDHGNGEFSFLAHLQRGSVTVTPGQRVQAGEVVGRCGNSGNSSEPHLHYHLQTTAHPGRGEGLPPQFQGYTGDGRQVERGEPTRGQSIRG